MSIVYRYDFTLKSEIISSDEIKELLTSLCKKWVFQEEESNGYKHFQGRFSLFKKKRKCDIIHLGFPRETHFTITSSNCKGFKYVMKKDTRISGPWKDTDNQYIPRQYRGMMKTLRPFQKTIIESVKIFNSRIINLVYCPKGNIGKSTIASLCELHMKGIDLPCINNSEKLISSVCNICMDRDLRNPNPIFVDLPKSFNQDDMRGFYTAIEQIKKGKLFDVRYKYKVYWIDSPSIWVFTNVEPYLKYLSLDRWRIWTVNKAFELQKYKKFQLEHL